MNRICKAGVAMMLSFCLVSVFLIGAFPQSAGAAEKNEFSDPRVESVTTNPSAVSVGNPFDANITFLHNYIAADDTSLLNAIGKIEINVSCPNGSIQLRNTKYTLDVKNNNIIEDHYADAKAEEDGNSDGFTYKLYIPEKDLKYVGPTSGTLRFTITYYDDSGDKIPNGKFVIQKTVAFADGGAENAILVDEDSPMPSVQAGTTGIVNIPLVSNGVSGDVQITASLPDGVKISFASAGSIYKMHFNDAEKKNLGLNLKIDSSVPEGVYPITLAMGSQTITAYLQILNASGGTGKLVVQGFQLNRPVVNEGQNFTMTVTVKNNSGATYNNVVVALPGLSQDAITANGTMDRKTIPSLEAGKTASVTFPLTCNNKMATGNYKLGIQLSADELEASPEANVFVPVKGSKSEGESTNASQPQIIIESYDYGGLSVVGGQEFVLKMDFKNTSKSYSIENLKMTVGNPASENDNDVAAFTPSKSSNTFFIENVGPGAVFHEEIALYPKADATPKSYGVTVTYSFEYVADGVRTPVKDMQETISIPLTQPDRFEVQDVVVYGPIMLGDQASLQINYVNKGKNTVYNVSLTLEGENFTSGDMNSYIGNVESGSSDYFETTLSAESEGTMTGKAIITYEDANGDSKEIVKEFSCEVMPPYQPPIDEPTGPVEPEAAPGMPVWAVWVVIGGGAVVVILSLVLIKKSMKAKKQRIVDEAENYDDASTGSGEE